MQVFVSATARLDDVRDADPTASVEDALQNDNVVLRCENNIAYVATQVLGSSVSDDETHYTVKWARLTDVANGSCKVVFRSVFVQGLGAIDELSSDKFALPLGQAAIL